MAALMYMDNVHSLTFVFGSFAQDAHCLKKELELSSLAVLSAAALTMAAALYFYLRGQRAGGAGKGGDGFAWRPPSAEDSFISLTETKAERAASSLSPAAAAAFSAATTVSDADVMGCDATLCGVVELLAAAVVFFGARAAEQAACGGLSKMVAGRG